MLLISLLQSHPEPDGKQKGCNESRGRKGSRREYEGKEEMGKGNKKNTGMRKR